MKTWHYHIRWNESGKSSGWARVLLAEDGHFSCVSDWINLAFGWWQDWEKPPRDFRWHWLGMFDEVRYFAGKHTNETEADIKRSVDNIRTYLYELRQEKRIAKDAEETWVWSRKRWPDRQNHPWYGDYAYISLGSDGPHGYREEADLLKAFEKEEIDERTYLEHTHIPEAYERLSYSPPRRHMTMAEYFLPALADAIAAELESEGQDVSDYRERRAKWEAKRKVEVSV